jgi:hypothetical protein
VTPDGLTTKSGRSSRLRRALALTIAFIAFARPGAAEDLLVNFDIPVQPLATALEAFSAASGYQILMAEAGAEKIPSHAVKGVLSPQDALARMISGTGLEARVTGDRSAIVVRDSRPTSTSTALHKDERDYDAVLQNMVMTRLCQDAVTRPGQYRTALDLWVTSFGRVERVDLLSSTGDPVRDQRIVAALNDLRAVLPPAGLAQPTTMLVLPGPTATQACETVLARRKVMAP